MQKLAAVTMTLILAACGGGGAPSTSASLTLSLDGTAATGAAISDATIEANCTNGTATSTSGADGTFTIRSTTAMLPCFLKVTVPLTGEDIYSLAEIGATRANITPLTNLVAGHVLGAEPSTKFSSFSDQDRASITSQKLIEGLRVVKAATTAAGIDLGTTDPLKVTLKAATEGSVGDPHDEKIDQLMAALAAADKSIADLSEQLANAKADEAKDALLTTLGAASHCLDSCPYARGGNFWSFLYDGTGLTEWALDAAAKKITNVGADITYSVTELQDADGNVVPCAYTFSRETYTTTVYRSAGGVAMWKEQDSVTQGWQFGLAVPKQASHRLASTKFVGRMPGLIFVDADRSVGRHLDAGAFYFDIDSSGGVAVAHCDLATGTPTCDSTAQSDSDTMTCSSLENGTISCVSKDGSVSATVLPFVTQQEPSLFVMYNATVSGYSTNALMIATKASKIPVPSVGATTTKSMAWYAASVPKNNAATGWTFDHGDSWFGPETTISAVDAAAGIVTYSSGQVRYLNTPVDGTYWIPSWTRSDGTGASNSIALRSRGGWTVAATATAGNRTFDGRSFFIQKPE